MLVYVDGFEAPIESLSTAEIESVTLLKDASALALYGMRGANGVLLVTTKKGCVSCSASQYPFANGNTTTVGCSRSYQCV